ncbi:MAG: ABC transporter permease [Deltaproteobacteria bacterium]|nr:ABC transporter permease [Deltaproteobacteria bacterium]
MTAVAQGTAESGAFSNGPSAGGGQDSRSIKVVAVLAWLSGIAVVAKGLMLLMRTNAQPPQAAFLVGFGLLWSGLGLAIFRKPSEQSLSLAGLLALGTLVAALLFKSVWGSTAVRWTVLVWSLVVDLSVTAAYVHFVQREEHREGALLDNRFLRIAHLAGASQVVCLRNTGSIAWRELKRYFRAPSSYVILGLFLVYQGLVFYIAVRYLNDPNAPHGAPMKFFFGGPFWFWPLECFIIAIITMDTMADEQIRRTIEPMLTVPVHESELVIGKFLGALGFFVFLWVGTFMYVVMLVAHAQGIHPASVMNLALFGGFAALWLFLSVGTNRVGFSGVATWVMTAVAGVAAVTYGSSGLAWGRVLSLLGVTAVPVAAVLGRELIPSAKAGWARFLLGAIALAGYAVLAWYGYDLTRVLFHEAGRNAPNLGPVLSGYLGAVGIGAAGIALGILFSSLTRDLKLSCMLTFIVLFLLIIVKIMLLPEVNIIETSWVRHLMMHLNFFDYMYDFSRGIVDTRQLTLLGTVIVLCLYGASRAVQVFKGR